MAAILALFVLGVLLLLVGVAAILVWAVDMVRTSLANRKWRVDSARSVYIPSRVWIDGRYGEPDADPTRPLACPDYERRSA